MTDYEKALATAAKVNSAIGKTRLLVDTLKTAQSANDYIDNTTALAIAYLNQSLVELEDSRDHLTILCENLETETSQK